jgi:Pvc16 N-terminal domain
VSNSLAIAAVTSTLRYVLDRSLESNRVGQVGGASVTTLHPGNLATSDVAGSAGINVFCFLATPNHAWNLDDLPTRRGDGTLTARPVAAVDLHYLVTCYGDDTRLEPQRLLGRVAVALKTTSVLTRDVVAAALDLYAGDTDTAFLADADLADEVELVKLSPVPLSLEEMSKLWGVLDAPYLLSQTYLATVVLVSADVAPTSALPVLQRSIGVSPYAPPRVDAVVTEPADQPVTTGTTLLVTGSGLVPAVAATVRVVVGPAELDPQPGGRADAVRVVVGEAVPAGLHAVGVRHRSPAGPAGTPPARVTATSNSVPVLVRPVVTVGAVDATAVTLAVAPPLQAGQRASVLLSRLDDAAPDATGALTVVLPPVSSAQAPLAEVRLSRADLPSGNWLVRVQVDGVQSLPGLVGDVYGTPNLDLP